MSYSLYPASSVTKAITQVQNTFLFTPFFVLNNNNTNNNNNIFSLINDFYTILYLSLSNTSQK